MQPYTRRRMTRALHPGNGSSSQGGRGEKKVIWGRFAPEAFKSSATFHIRTLSSSSLARIRFSPSGENATVRGEITWLSRAEFRPPVATVQSPSNPSLPAVARSEPSGENATELTGRRVPGKHPRYLQRFQVPEANIMLREPGCGQQGPVWREGERHGRAVGILQQQLPSAGLEIPHEDRSIIRGTRSCSEPSAVGRKRNAHK